MAAIWLLLGKTRYPATFFQSYNGKAWVTNVPFDLVVDFVPEAFREADSHLQHLTSQSPGKSKASRKSPATAGPFAWPSAEQSVRQYETCRSCSWEKAVRARSFSRGLFTSRVRGDSALSSINCEAISRELLESELFGHKAGSFSGAQRQIARVPLKKQMVARFSSTKWQSAISACKPNCSAFYNRRTGLTRATACFTALRP